MLPLTGDHPASRPAPSEFTLLSLPPLFFFRCLVFFGLATFHVAFMFVMPSLATVPARDRVAQVVLVFYLLTSFSFLLGLQVEVASVSPITLMKVARSAFAVRRTTVKKLWGQSPLEGRVSCMCFN